MSETEIPPSYSDANAEVLDGINRSAPVEPAKKKQKAQSPNAANMVNIGNRAASKMNKDSLGSRVAELEGSKPDGILGKILKSIKIKVLKVQASGSGALENYSDMKIEESTKEADKAREFAGKIAKIIEGEIKDAAKELRDLAKDIGQSTGFTSMGIVPVINALIEAGASVPEEYEKKSAAEVMADRVVDRALDDLISTPKFGLGGKIHLDIKARMAFKESLGAVAEKMQRSFEDEVMPEQSHRMSPDDYKVAKLSTQVNCDNAGYRIADELKMLKKTGQLSADGIVSDITLRIPDGKGGFDVEKFDQIDLKKTNDVALLVQHATGRDLGARMNAIGKDNIKSTVGKDDIKSTVGKDNVNVPPQVGKDLVNSVKKELAISNEQKPKSKDLAVAVEKELANIAGKDLGKAKSEKPLEGEYIPRAEAEKMIDVAPKVDHLREVKSLDAPVSKTRGMAEPASAEVGSSRETANLMKEMFAEAKMTPEQLVQLLGLRENQSLDPETMTVETKNVDGTISVQSVENHIENLPQNRQDFLNEGMKQFKEIVNKNADQAQAQAQAQAQGQGIEEKPAEAKPKGQYDVTGMKQKIRDAALRGEDVSNLVMAATQGMEAVGLDPASMRSFGQKAITISKDVQAKQADVVSKAGAEKTAVEALKAQEAKAKEDKGKNSQSADGQETGVGEKGKKDKAAKVEEEKKKKAKKSKLATLVSKLVGGKKKDDTEKKKTAQKSKLAAMKSMKIHSDKVKDKKVKAVVKDKKKIDPKLAAAAVAAVEVAKGKSTDAVVPAGKPQHMKEQGNQRQ